ncbi:RNA-directed DNA polymerase from mobile element jockey-like [Brachionus plicatilis]|uniref:RNA-directed DNA polymerase from mobile element jockey-like n=1 Tax=Brachionus plicatilis TaxID=10195 RepID=A0A3M7QFY9_BRAPC|nr:RNA-directed DNA polymerase from mobile element jockey-like [Brachionus plicatilis]
MYFVESVLEIFMLKKIIPIMSATFFSVRTLIQVTLTLTRPKVFLFNLKHTSQNSNFVHPFKIKQLLLLNGQKISPPKYTDQCPSAKIGTVNTVTFTFYLFFCNDLDFTIETSDGPGTPVSTQMNLNVISSQANKKSKTRPINEVDNSPLFDDESHKALRTKVLNLEIENEAQKSLIDKLTNKLNDLVNKVLAINTYDAYVIEQKKLPDQRSNQKPAVSEYQINVLNSASDEINEQERRKKKLIVFGVPISKKKEALDRKRNDEEEINKILEFINDGIKTEKIVIRFKPKSESDTTTPILIKFKDEVTRNEILSKAKKLRSEKNAFQRIYLNPDLTIAQQHNYKRLREECKNANTNEVDKRYMHVIRNNSVRRGIRNDPKQNVGSSKEKQSYFINERSPDFPKSSQMQTNIVMSPKLTRNKEKTQLQSTDLNIICYNCKNIQSNYLYVQKLLKENDIIFLSETWLKDKDSFSEQIFEDSLTYFQSGMDHYFGRGRPYGGIGWIVSKKIDKPMISEVKFHSRRISSIEKGNFTLIGVYLTSNDSTKESVIEHKIDLAELNEVTGELQRQEKLYLIIGDFNSDPWRNNTYDKQLVDFLIEKDLNCLEKNF